VAGLTVAMAAAGSGSTFDRRLFPGV